jgi:hypothetical protein
MLNLEEKVKKMGVWDIGLLKLSVLLFTIILVKLFPQLLDISYTVLIALVIILVVRPVYTVWLKK